MPTYVYRREDGTTFEVFQRITEDPLETDPETGQKVERVIGGGAGLIFKGQGFYLTDYVRKGNGGEGKEAKAEKKSASGGSESKGASKSESSSATKSE